MFCGHCRTSNPDDLRYCVSCGADLAAQRSPAARTPAARTPPARTPGHVGDSLDFADTQGPPRGEGGAALAPGQMVAGRWRVEVLVGRGGMGEVYRVYDERTKRTRALKLIHPGWLRSESVRERFQEEAALAQELVHERIARTFEVGDSGTDLFYVMELIEGGSLRDRLVAREKERKAGQRAQLFAPDEAARLVDEILEGLAYAHARGVLHRDIKPENVLLTGDGHVKLADFGLAKLVDPARLASMSQAVGTPLYMAPEQLKAKGQVDARADLYAVGVVLYELLVGEVPLGAFQPPSGERADLPADLDKLVLKALARRPEDRIGSAAEFRAAIAGLRGAARAASAPAPKPVARVDRPAPFPAEASRPAAAPSSSPGGRRSLAAVFAVGSIAVFGGVMWWTSAKRPAEPVVLQSAPPPRSAPAPSSPPAETPPPVAAPAAKPIVTPSPEVQPEPTPPPGPSAEELELQRLEERAESLYQQKRFTTPANDNAVAVYREILKKQPSHAKALSRLKDMRDYYVRQATSAEQSGDLEGADAQLGKAQAVLPEDEEVSTRRRTLASKKAEAARRAEEEQRQAALKTQQDEEAARQAAARDLAARQAEAARREEADRQRQASAVTAPRGQRFVSQGDGTVVDTQTGLQWAAQDNGSDIDWPGAKRYAENLTLGGYSDWRLPTQDELSALYEAGKAAGRRYGPACRSSGDNDTVASPPAIQLSCWAYWASETRGSEAAHVYFLFGTRYFHPQGYSTNLRVLPVRVRN